MYVIILAVFVVLMELIFVNINRIYIFGEQISLKYLSV